jgi:hypothetical protein
MTTAEKLEALTDPGVFEILCLRVLRQVEEDCRTIIHLGINAAGKTIAGSLDAFCLVPGSTPDRYASAAFTLTRLKALERKWLLSPASSLGRRKSPKKRPSSPSGPNVRREAGDLIKAAAKAARIRQDNPSAQFVVYLCSNRGLTEELIGKVLATARSLDLTVRFLEQTQLRDFLDTTPEGQWLRQEHLGIDADQVSASLLASASQISFQRYSAAVTLVPQHATQPTKGLEDASGALLDRFCSLHLLIGPSGSGKSVIALQLHARYLTSGGFCLWIPGEVADRAISVWQAVDEVLRSIHPRMEKGAGRNALRFGTEDRPLLLIVDDINRSSAPPHLLNKIIRWFRPDTDRANSGSAEPTALHVVCPVWESHWAMLHDEHEMGTYLHIQPIRGFRRSESIAYLGTALSGRSGIDAAELDRCAEVVNDDPVLLSLLADSMRREPNTNALAVSHDVIRHWTDVVIREASSKTKTPTVAYRWALRHVAGQMIRHRTLYPSVDELRNWCSCEPTAFRSVTELADHGHVCMVRQEAEGENFQFRHDRIRDYYFSLVLGQMLAGPETPADAVWDPFFTSHVGRAIALEAPSADALEAIELRAPLSLIAAIPYLAPENPQHAMDLVRRVRAWLSDGQRCLPWMLDSALWMLRDMQSPFVLTVTDDSQDNRMVWEARLRNGDVRTGIRLLCTRFFPGTTYPWLEALIEQARNRHEARMTAELQSIMLSDGLDDTDRSGALSLAGYLGGPSLSQAVAVSWGKAKSKTEVVLPALWAALRCPGPRSQQSIPSMVQAVLGTEDDPTGRSHSGRSQIFDELGFASRHGFSDSGLRELVKLGYEKAYRDVVVELLAGVPHPLVIPFVVEQLAVVLHAASEAGSFSPFAFGWCDQWRRQKEEGIVTLRCVAALRSLWEDETRPDWLRNYALMVWNAATDDLTSLQLIPPSSCLYESAIYQRMLLGDRDSSRAVLAMIGKHALWIRHLSCIWSEDLKPFISDALAKHAQAPPPTLRSNSDFALAELLRDLPTQTSEALLLDHWHHLRSRPLFIQAALYISTDATRSLAREALTHIDCEPFKLIGAFFGFRTRGLADRLTMSQLQSLQPYVAQLDDMLLAEMVDFCGDHGELEWAKSNIRPEYERRTKSLAGEHRSETQHLQRALGDWLPSQADLFSQLSTFATEGHPYFRLKDWSEKFVRRGQSLDQMCATVKQWFDAEPSTARLRIVSLTIKHWGRRSDLEFLRSAFGRLSPDAIAPSLEEVQFTVCRRSLE